MKKKHVLLIATMVILVSLTACSSSTSELADAKDALAEPVVKIAQAEIDEATKLMVGTLLLNGTENEVSPENAATLLPLWQLYSSLSTSDIVAQVEIDAVVTQIQNMMTEAQMTAIDAMDLSRQNITTLFKESGLFQALQAELSDAQKTSGDFSGAGKGSIPQDGIIPSGGKGGGLRGGSGIDMDPAIKETQMAAEGKTGSSGQSSQVYLRLLIRYLENMTAESAD